MRNAAVWIGFLATLPLAGCGGDDPKLGVAQSALLQNGAACTQNGDCASNVCSGGVCAASPDLVVTAMTGVPAQASQQQLLSVSWTVNNQGTAQAKGSTVGCCTQTDHGSYQYTNIWFDRFYLSTDATLSSDDVFIAESARPDQFTLNAAASYTASASIHVPTVTPGAYYLIVATDGYGNRVVEGFENNNTYAVPVTVGQADLLAKTLTGVPAQASQQQLLSVQWTIQNLATAGAANGSYIGCCSQTDHGSYQYNNIWFDRFFLSTDQALSSDDVFIAEYARPDNYSLAAGASYTASGSIHVPSVAPGNYYLILSTDGYGNRVPESNETNNTLAIAVTIGQADLAVSALNGVPAQVSDQELLPVTWTVTNQAASGGATGSYVGCCSQTDHGSYQYNNIWFDRFFLSTDQTLSSDDVFIAEYARPDNYTLAAGGSYTASGSIHVPTAAPGNYYLILITDGYGNRVPESNETNNTIAIPVSVGQADLVATALTGIPSQANAQQLLPISWTVANQATGGAATGSYVGCCSQTDHGSYQYNNIWFDRFFLSTDQTLSSDDTFIGEYARPDGFTLAAGGSYTGSASIHVPSVASGNYYVLLVIDGYGNRVPESNETNNTLAMPITVGQADLQVTALTGVPSQASVQQLLPVSWTVNNAAAFGGASGSYVGCCTQTDHGSYQYNNIWFDRFFLSTDQTLSSDDAFIAEYARPDGFTLAAGTSYTASASIHVPTVAPGSYYVIVVTDGYGNRVVESNESNNTLAIPVTVGQADLVAAAVNGVPSQASVQQLLPLTWTVTNQATSGAASGSYVGCCSQTDHGSYQYNNIWFDRFFLSTDQTLSSDDVFISESARPDNFTLAGGTSYTASASIHVPTVAAGNYYLLLVTDAYGNRVPESNESNNVLAIALTVGQPDLVVTSLTGVPSQASAQQLLPVNWTVANQAQYGAASGSYVGCCSQTDHGSYQYNNIWFDRFFLSTDQTLSSDDTFIGEYARPDGFTLPAGSSYSASASIHVPTVAAGNYYVLLAADGYGNRVPESNENNNTIAIAVTVGQADLAVVAVTGIPQQTANQQLIPVTWTVTNQASNGAANGSYVGCCSQTDHGSYQYNNLWFDRFYVSTDQTLSADDTFVGEYPRRDGFTLAAGASYTGTANIQIPKLQPGSYYVIFAADAYGNRVPESNESNNTQAIPFTAVGDSDLVAVSLTGVPAKASSQQVLPLSWTIRNNASGGAASGSLVPCCAQTDHGSYQFNNLWFDRLYLSNDSTISADDTFLGEFARPDGTSLAAGSSYNGTNTVQWPRLPAGNYYLILQTDGYGNRVSETDETNNTIAIPIQGATDADLVASNVVAPTGVLGTQQQVPVTWTVTNQGSGTAYHSWMDRIYVSQNPNYDSTATYVDFVQHTTDLPSGMSYTTTKNVKVPQVGSGNYYFLVFTEATDLIAEASETNNVATSPGTISLQTTAIVKPSVALNMPTGAANASRSPAFSPDGSLLAVADGNRADLWRMDTLAPTGSFTGHTSTLASVRFSPFGDQVLSASLDGTLRTWDPSTFVQKASYSQYNYFNPAVFSADGNTIIAGSDKAAKLWDAKAGALLGTFATNYSVTAVALAPNNSVAVTGAPDGTVTLWNAATYTTIATLKGHTDKINAAAFSPDGSEFLTASSDGSIRIWAASTGAALATLVQGRHVVDAHYTSDGQYIVSCDDFAPGHTEDNTQAYLFKRSGLLVAIFQPQGWVDGVTATLGGVRPGFTGVAISPDRTKLATTMQTNSTDPVSVVYTFDTGLPAIPTVPSVPVAVGSNYSFTIQPRGLYLFELAVADAQPGLIVKLTGSPNSATYASNAGSDPVALQMFSSANGVPSPSTHADQADVVSSTLTGSVLASPTVGGTYRVLVTAPQLTGGTISAQIAASYSGFALTSVDGNKVGNAGRATVRVRGIQLLRQVALVSPTGATLTPIATAWRDPTRVFATFDLTGQPVGNYDLQATSGSTVLTLPAAVNVKTGTGPSLSYSLKAPPALRKNRAYDYALTYVNNGDSDAIAPFISIAPAEPNAILYPDGSRMAGSATWLAGADGWPSAVIPAGQSGTIRFQASWKTTAGLTTTVLSEDSTPFDWAQIFANLPPTAASAWTTAQNALGTTYQSVLGEMRGIAATGNGPVELSRVVLAALIVTAQGDHF